MKSDWEEKAFQEDAPGSTRRAPNEAKDDGARLSGWKRLGYALLGLAIAAMGFWIFPYQVERGDLLKALTGAALAVLGSLVLFRSLQRKRLRSLERVVDFLSDLAS